MAYRTNKIERRPWTLEEKKSVLKSCGSRCACCGKKLTMKTLTMEHVVPISKGGENVLNNLVALCEPCNSKKGNTFYLPLGYYMALNNKSKLVAIDNYTNKWISENISKDNLSTYPIFTEALALFIKPKMMDYNFKNGAYIPSLIMDMHEVDAFTARPILKSFGLTEKDIFSSVVDGNKDFSLIAVNKRTSDEFIALYTIQLWDDRVYINEVFSSSWIVNRALFIGFITIFGERWGNYGVDLIMMRMKDKKTYDGIYSYYCDNLIPMPVRYFMNRFDQFEYEGKDDSLHIYGENQLFVKTIRRDQCLVLKAESAAKEFMRKQM